MKIAYSLIKSGGGNGPMKPGNLAIRLRCQIRRQTRDEDSIQHTSNASMCAFFILV